MPPTADALPHPTTIPARQNSPASQNNVPLFLDPMLGLPLQIYIELDVPDRETLVGLVKDHGGIISGGYSSVPYILVDPTKESGQSLYLQYIGKKGKVVLDAKWIYKCVEAGQLQTYQTNFANCKVNGTERVPDEQRNVDGTSSVHHPPLPPIHIPSHEPSSIERLSSDRPTGPEQLAHGLVQMPSQSSASSSSLIHSAPLIFNPNERAPIPDSQSPSSNWNSGVRHLPYGSNPPVHPWSETFDQGPHQTPQPYEFHYRTEEQWAPASSEFFTSQFQPNVPFHQSQTTFAATSTSVIPSGINELPQERPPRPRPKSKSNQSPKAKGKQPRLLVANASPERSPTPPRRVLKSIHGGNNFTEDDVKYLEKYIDYCRRQGLPLSLREICERLAVKAPHHTFYSWRRYCNKHQIRLGGYEMEEPSPSERSDSPQVVGTDHDVDQQHHGASMAQLSDSLGAPGGAPVVLGDPTQTGGNVNPPRARSPSPPRMLFRSTTGKGIAFTTADVNFLVRYLEYYRSKDENVNMVQFWKRIAEKAPHHSRASWMKYWRRHKHELEGVAPAIPRPDKKRKYDFKDDLLLAKYFSQKPIGTSDAIFQAFARDYPHHPWKGWQEHHRIHKAKIDHLIQQIETGELQLPEQIP